MIYNQNAFEYSKILAGYNTDYRWTLQTVGCYIFSFCNMLEFLDINIGPVELNEKMKANNCFTPRGAFYIAGTITRVFDNIIQHNIQGYNSNTAQAVLTAPNQVMILNVDFGNGSDHFVGLNTLDTIIDSNGGVIRPVNYYTIKKMVILTKIEEPNNNNNDIENMLKDKILNNQQSPDYKALQSDEQHAFALDSFAPEYLAARINGLRDNIANLKARLEEKNEEIKLVNTPKTDLPKVGISQSLMADVKLPNLGLDKSQTPPTSQTIIEANRVQSGLDVLVPNLKKKEKWSWHTFFIGFAKLNIDKATAVMAITSVLVYADIRLGLNLGASNMASVGGLIATALVGAGLIKN